MRKSELHYLEWEILFWNCFNDIYPKSQTPKPVPTYSIGAMHIAFEVDDIYKYKQYFEKVGVNIISGPNIETVGPFKGWSWMYFSDPDGIYLELVQYAPNIPYLKQNYMPFCPYVPAQYF